jgi:haloalkane dehalogenase
MAILTVAEQRFADVPDFEYEPQYVTLDDGLRMAYVEAGGGDETVLCLHGEPSWSFLYRTMIPRLTDVGRVVAPDFPGFGRSDRYDAVEDYTFEGMYDALATFLEELDLAGVTLVGQDWGGILGLLAAARQPDRFARIVAMNTGLPDGSEPLSDAWEEFRAFVERTEDLPIGTLIDNATISELDDATLSAYEAPFPSVEHKAGARAWPLLVPTDPDDPGADAMREARDRLAEWDKPAFVLFGDSDPITHGARDPLRELIPTASEQPDVWVEDAAHFLQEDAGPEIADRIVEFVGRT